MRRQTCDEAEGFYCHNSSNGQSDEIELALDSVLCGNDDLKSHDESMIVYYLHTEGEAFYIDPGLVLFS